MRASAILAGLLALPSALATLSQGHINKTRDYQIEYTGYNTTAAFCSAWHNGCVNYAGPLEHHHILDCVTSQTGPVIWAFCGGAQKDANCDWSPSDNVPIDPYTTLMVNTVKGAKIVGNPTTSSVASASLNSAYSVKVSLSFKLTTSTTAAPSSTAKAVSTAKTSSNPLATNTHFYTTAYSSLQASSSTSPQRSATTLRIVTSVKSSTAAASTSETLAHSDGASSHGAVRSPWWKWNEEIGRWEHGLKGPGHWIRTFLRYVGASKALRA